MRSSRRRTPSSRRSGAIARLGATPGVRRHRSDDLQPERLADRGSDHAAHPRDHSGSSLRPDGGHGCDHAYREPAQPRGDRGRGPGHRRRARRASAPVRSAITAASHSSHPRISAPPAMAAWSSLTTRPAAARLAVLRAHGVEAEVLPQGRRRQFPARCVAGGDRVREAAAPGRLDGGAAAQCAALRPSLHRGRSGQDRRLGMRRWCCRPSRPAVTSSTSTSFA